MPKSKKAKDAIVIIETLDHLVMDIAKLKKIVTSFMKKEEKKENDKP